MGHVELAHTSKDISGLLPLSSDFAEDNCGYDTDFVQQVSLLLKTVLYKPTNEKLLRSSPSLFNRCG